MVHCPFAAGDMDRGLLACAVTAPFGVVVVGTTHLESPEGPGNKDNFRDRERQAEAAFTTLGALGVEHGAVALLLLGDLNATRGAEEEALVPRTWCDAWLECNPDAARCWLSAPTAAPSFASSGLIGQPRRANSPTSGGTLLTLVGSGFGLSDGTPTLRVGETACEYVSWRSDEAVYCLTPKGTGRSRAVGVTVGEESAMETDAFSYDAPVRYLHIH